MTPAELVDASLDREQVSITRLDNGVLSYFGSDRQLRQSEVDRFVQLRAIGGREAAATGGRSVAELTDGQRIVGEWAGAEDAGPGGPNLLWRHRELGVFALPLDRLKAVRLSSVNGNAQADQTPTQDIVTLVNGDRLRGFIAELTADAVVLQPDTGDEPWELPRRRISMLRLANPDEALEPGRELLLLADGTRLAVTELTVSGGRVHFDSALRQGDPRGQLALDALAGIDFTAGGRRLAPLIDQPMRVLAGGEVFGLPVPPRTVGRTLRLQAPVRVAFDLPEGVERVTFIAELADDADAPAHLKDWADFELVVRADGEDGERRYRLHGSQPRVQVNATVDGPTLEIELEPGMNGPILDRLRLRDASILIYEPRPTSPGL